MSDKGLWCESFESVPAKVGGYNVHVDLRVAGEVINHEVVSLYVNLVNDKNDIIFLDVAGAKFDQRNSFCDAIGLNDQYLSVDAMKLMVLVKFNETLIDPIRYRPGNTVISCCCENTRL